MIRGRFGRVRASAGAEPGIVRNLAIAPRGSYGADFPAREETSGMSVLTVLAIALSGPVCAASVSAQGGPAQDGPAQELSRSLPDRALANLEAFARLFGWIRWFHPSDEAVAADWERLLIDHMALVERAEDSEVLVARLADAFRDVAPSLVLGTGEPPADAASRIDLPASARSIRWVHLGVGVGLRPSGAPEASSVYRSTRIPRSEPVQDPERIVRRLPGGGWCAFAAALPLVDGATLPRAAAGRDAASRLAHDRPPASGDREVRLAAVMTAWNIMQHFYPYFGPGTDAAPAEVDADWDAALREALASAATDPDDTAFLRTLRRLVHHLHDGHGGVHAPHLVQRTRLPFDCRWIEEALVVTGVVADAAPLAVGDVIEAIDGRPVLELRDEVERTVSAATAGWRRHMSAQAIVTTFETRPTVLLGVRGDGASTRLVEVSRVPIGLRPAPWTTRPANGDRPADGIIYFDLCGAPLAALTPHLPAMAEAKGVIFDLRGYPDSAATAALQHLADDVLASARWIIPRTSLPDRLQREFVEFPGWRLPPLEPRIRGRVAFLTDARAISYAESILGIVEQYRLGEIVGERTAGTNGNVNPLVLPGGFHVSWTGMRVRKHDHSAHHGIGIAPTVPVAPTIGGIRAGRDKVLERAVALLTAS